MNDFLRDLLVRAAHTFWQFFVAAVGVVWAGSGIDAAHLTDLSAWQKLAVGVIGAAVAAALSTVKTLIAGFKNGQIGAGGYELGDVAAVEDDDTEPDDTVVMGAHTQMTPADPDQPAAGTPPGYTPEHAAHESGV